jgi:hypothetical protein
MNTAVPLLPVYAFMVCILTILPLRLPLPQHPALVLCCSYIPAKVGVNQGGINKKLCSHQKEGVEYGQPEGS